MEELTRRPFVIDTPEGSITALLPLHFASKIETDPLAEEDFKEKISEFQRKSPGVMNILVYDDGAIEPVQTVEEIQQTAEESELTSQTSDDDDNTAASFKWTPEITKSLIDEVHAHQKENPKQVKKKMFQEITRNLNKEKNLALTETQVTNKYKTLMRGYKNVVDNNKKTGTARKHHPFEKELGDLTKGNPNIKPTHTLTSAAGVAASSSSDDSVSKEDPPKCSKEPRKRPRSEITEFLREESERQDQRFKLFMDQMEKMQEKKLEMFREIFGPKKD